MKTKSFLLSAAVLILPVLEIALLHSAVRSVLGRNNTVVGIYSRDVYVPLLMGIFFSIAWLDSRRAFLFRLQSRTVALNLSAMVFLGVLLLNFDTAVTTLGAGIGSAFLILGACFLALTGLGLFLPLGELLSRIRAFGSRLWFLVLALAFLITYPYLLRAVWPWLASWTGHSVSGVLSLLGFSIEKLKLHHSIVLQHPDLYVSIGMGCSGLEGIFFFLFAYSLYLLFLGRYSWSLLGVYALGTFYMFALNIIRIVLFFAVAVFINQSASGYGRRFFVWAFHENIGWILYVAGLSVFFAVLARWSPPPKAARR